MDQLTLTNIFVARPTLPKLDALMPLLEGAWDRKMVTNFGPLETELTQNIKQYLKLNHVSLFSNGHLALEAMLGALDKKGEVITSPFTFASTVHAIINTGHTPVFVDVENDAFGPDPVRVESAITQNTSAVLGVHVYGVPCNTNELAQIGKQHNVPILYDAAHCFGVIHNNRSLISYGDASSVSTHATKIFNTIEGGFVSCNSDSYDTNSVNRFRNFGQANDDVFPGGTNAKMSELHAAVGLLNLETFSLDMEKRKANAKTYNEAFSNIEEFSPISPSSPNACYYPVQFNGGPNEARKARGIAIDRALELGVHSRPYFSPSLNLTTAFREYANGKSFPRSEALSASVLCLPIFETLENDEQARVIHAFKG